MRLFGEIGFGGRIDIAKPLRIAIHQRKPTRLDLHHDPVSWTKAVANVRHGERNFGQLARFQRFWFGKAVTKLGPKWLPSNEHLIIAHANPGWIGFQIGIIPWKNINHFYHKIRVRSRALNPEVHLDWPGDQRVAIGLLLTESVPEVEVRGSSSTR